MQILTCMGMYDEVPQNSTNSGHQQQLPPPQSSNDGQRVTSSSPNVSSLDCLSLIVESIPTKKGAGGCNMDANTPPGLVSHSGDRTRRGSQQHSTNSDYESTGRSPISRGSSCSEGAGSSIASSPEHGDD
uniref:Myogenic determination factor 5 domain-containing protein n=1 Tax=Romanomermis culicivorax TaxID=13658 RepID=A0A915K7Q9_ROMCU